jgi:hypothetical protein
MQIDKRHWIWDQIRPRFSAMSMLQIPNANGTSSHTENRLEIIFRLPPWTFPLIISQWSKGQPALREKKQCRGPSKKENANGKNVYGSVHRFLSR